MDFIADTWFVKAKESGIILYRHKDALKYFGDDLYFLQTEYSANPFLCNNLAVYDNQNNVTEHFNIDKEYWNQRSACFTEQEAVDFCKKYGHKLVIVS